MLARPGSFLGGRRGRRWVSLTPGAGPFTLATLGVGPAGICTVLWKGTLNATGIGAEQVLLQLDGGSDANCFYARNFTSNTAIQVLRTLASAVVAQSLSNATAGVSFTLAITIAGDGSIRGSFNGGAANGVTGGPTSGITTLRVQNNAAGTRPGAGTVTALRVLPAAVSDSALVAISAAG